MDAHRTERVLDDARAPAGARARASGAGRPASRLGALRYPQYARYWLGSLASIGGTQLQILGGGWLVFELSSSPLDLGLLGAAAAVPAIIMTLFGGVLADRLDKRRLLMFTTLATASLLVLLGALDLIGVVEVWHVIAIAGVIGLISGLDWPTRQAIFPHLIGREQMMSAVALNSMLWQGTRMVIPALGGAAIAAFGTHTVFFAGGAGFVVMFGVLLTLRTPGAQRGHFDPLRQLVEGFSYIARHRLFAVIIPLTYVNMFFGASYVQLMPVFADEFESGVNGFGYLLAASGIGAVAGTVFASFLQGARRLGWLMLASQVAAGAALIAFSGSPFLAAALAAAFVNGGFNSIFMISSMTVLQLRVPDAMRGRVMGIHGITFSFIPLGGLFIGAVAAAANVRIAVAIGALIVLVAAFIVALTQTSVRRLDGRAAR